MEVINISEIKKGKIFNYGSFSYTYKVNVGGIDYIYKEYIDPINPIVKKIVSDLTEKEYNECFLTPKYLIETRNGQNILGYLSNYNKNLIELDDCFNYDLKIKLLKEARIILDKWHKESKRIHGDINLGNMLFDIGENKAYLIDFDTSLKIGIKNYKKMLDYNFPFSDYIYEYLAYYPLNEDIDSYLFNLTTLMTLSNDNYIGIMNKIRFDKLDFINENKDIKRLSKKLLFNDTKNSFGNEYIIDYLS